MELHLLHVDLYVW